MALNDKPSHFFGSIVSCAHGRDEILIIDGQQRITTVSLLLLAIVNAIKSGDLVPEDTQLARRIEDTCIVDQYSKNERKVRLKPFRNDCAAFDKLIYGSTSAEKPKKTRDKIIALLAEDGGQSAATIADKIGRSAKAVEKQLAKLKAEGLIDRKGPAKGGEWVVK